MPQIKVQDETIINDSIENVWKVLTYFSRYQYWWPKVVNLRVLKLTDDLIGTEFQASPLGGKSFFCRVISFIPNKEIRLEYFAGIYRGKGVWKLEEKKNSITVSYSVDLEIVDKSIALLSRIIPIPRLHSMIFKRILFGLSQQVKS